MLRGGRGGKAGLAPAAEGGRFESPPKPATVEVGLLRPFCPELPLLLVVPPWAGALNPGTETVDELSVITRVNQSFNPQN